MAAKYFAIDNRGYWKTVKTVCKRFPQFYTVTSFACRKVNEKSIEWSTLHKIFAILIKRQKNDHKVPSEIYLLPVEQTVSKNFPLSTKALASMKHTHTRTKMSAFRRAVLGTT